MKFSAIPFVLLLLALLGACTTQNEPVEEGISITNNEHGQRLVGMSEDQARAEARRMGRPFRVVKRDGKALMVTMDHVPGRLNASVDQGMVTSIHVEGEGVIKLNNKAQ